MVKSQMTPEIRQKIKELLKANPDKKPSEIIAMLQAQSKAAAVKTLTVQGVVAIRRQVEKEPTVAAPVVRTVRLKNLKTGKVEEVKTGEVKYFTLPGDTKLYSLEDFVHLVRKNCGEMKPVNENSEIAELPMGDLNIADLFASGNSR